MAGSYIENTGKKRKKAKGEMFMKKSMVRVLGVVVFAGVLFLVGCGKKSDSVSSKTADAVEKTGEALNKAAKKTGEAVNTAAKKTGEALNTAAEKTGEGINTAAEKTGEAVNTAAEKTSEATK